MFKNVIVAFGTISKIPVPTQKEIDLKKSTVYFPIVGILAAFINFVVYYFFSKVFTPSQNAILVMGIYFYLFQYFHFDGFVDVIDGFGAQIRTSEERIKIMKDSRTGAFALLFGSLYLILYYAFLKEFSILWFLAPVFSRLAMVYLIALSNPAKKTGLGSLYYPYNKKYMIYSTLIVFMLFPAGIKIILYGILVAISTALLMRSIAYKKIVGITGDVIGATCLIAEIVYLIFLRFI